MDDRNESVQYKVREAEMQKTPIVIVIGDKEQKAKTIAVRRRGVKGVKFGVKMDKFVNDITSEIEKKVL